MNKLAYVILVNYYRMPEIDILVDIFSYVVEIALFDSSTVVWTALQVVRRMRLSAVA